MVEQEMLLPTFTRFYLGLLTVHLCTKRGESIYLVTKYNMQFSQLALSPMRDSADNK